MKSNLTALSVVDKIIGRAPYMCEGDFADRIRYAKRMGFDGVEINIADPGDLNLCSIRTALDETGIRIVAFGTGRAYVNDGVSLTDSDASCRDEAINRMHTFLDLAREFNSLVILGCIRGNIKRPKENQKVLDLLADSMFALEEYANDRETAMILEPINRYENNFLCNVKETSVFIHSNGLKRTKILADTFHMNIEEPDFAETIRNYGSDIAYVHIADSNRYYPGCGHTDFDTIFRTFGEIGYKGPFCAECNAPADFDTGCREWHAYVQKMINKYIDR
jgi:sugar phosphate isomerase/epimerase